MHNMLTTLSLIALIGAAILSFMNKDNLANARADHLDLEKELTAAKEELTDSKGTLEALKADLASTTSEGEALAQEAEKIAADITAKDNELETIEEELNAAKDERDAQKEKLANLGDLEVALKNLEEMQASNATLAAERGSLASEVQSLTNASENLQSQIDNISKQIEDAEAGRVPESFSASIAQVYPKWGFVVIGAGNAQRAAEGAQLSVRRGGVEVAQVEITDLLQDRSVADLVQGTLIEGGSIQPGDRVVPVAQ